MRSPLESRWSGFWKELQAQGAPLPKFQILEIHYAEPHRAYHNLAHIEECLNELDRAAHLARDRFALALALWFHDVIYDPHRADNEEQSAALMMKIGAEAGIHQKTLEAAHELILVTKTHSGSGHSDIPLIVDIDLSILGKPAERFDEYESQIRQEYSWVPPQVFAVKRAEILEKFLARKTIYQTDLFRNNYEAQARKNLNRSIAHLRA